MSETYRIQYAPAAAEDLKDIFSYIAYELKEPQTAEKLVRRINEEVCLLDFMPLRYEQADWEPWKSQGMRKMPVGNFVVFYAVSHKTVDIFRILYGGSDIRRIATEK